MSEDAYMSLASSHVALAEEHRELETERDRLRTVVDVACAELDEIAEQSGWGNIGVVVQRLMEEFGLSLYPLDESTGPEQDRAQTDAEADRDRLRAIVRDTWAALWRADPSEVELLSPEHEAILPGVVRATMLAAVEHNAELSKELERLRAALRAVMTETGTSSLAHHYAQDALAASAEGTDG